MHWNEGRRGLDRWETAGFLPLSPSRGRRKTHRFHRSAVRGRVRVFAEPPVTARDTVLVRRTGGHCRAPPISSSKLSRSPRPSQRGGACLLRPFLKGGSFGSSRSGGPKLPPNSLLLPGLHGPTCRSAVARSGTRGSNPRPQAWEACALPAELVPQVAAQHSAHHTLSQELPGPSVTGDAATWPWLDTPVDGLIGPCAVGDWPHDQIHLDSDRFSRRSVHLRVRSPALR